MEFVVVHNGIITNFKDIKVFLEEKGVVFEFDTDTEVIPKFLKYLFELQLDTRPSFQELVEQVVHHFDGAYALVFESSLFPGEVVAARRGSPLLIGVKSGQNSQLGIIPATFSEFGKAGCCLCKNPSKPVQTPSADETGALFDNRQLQDMSLVYFFASDACAIMEHTNRLIYLEDDDVATVDATGTLSIHHLTKGESDTPHSRVIHTSKIKPLEAIKGSYDYFMQKEIFEQPESVVNTMRGRVNFTMETVVLGGLKDHVSTMRRARRLLFIACGTSYHSALATRQLLEELTELPVMIELASDFLDRNVPISRDDVVFFVSQSGETADTLNALRYCKPRGALCVGMTNIVGSSISRETHCGIHINAGPENGLVSTKAYTSQFISLVMVGLVMSADRISMQQRRKEIINDLKNLPEYIKEVLKLDNEILELAKSLCNKKSLIVMGRGFNFATCLEGALKIKELAYLHSEGILSGELKHGPLAMIDTEMPVIMIIMKDNTYTKCINALQQVSARAGRPIIICNEDDTTIEKKAFHCLKIPKVADCLQGILSVLPLQLLSFHIAVLKGHDVDCPRHFVRPVTIE
ncbi:glutamine--fructose-6-phosphate aminotransferase [isomerizing] 2-like isoform X2 [Dysidea avara]|uniref:glutamine--fructose-6-phosphate aminotransferase [isomerizing] 2-like isoform X2 n=1 Tax=Dysidea avara TaxID=196820 RepID=UPI0033247A8F